MSTDGLHLTEIWCKVDVSFSGFSKTKQNHVRYCDAMIFRNKYLKCKLNSESVRSSIWTITLKLYDIWFSGKYWRYESEFRVGRSWPDRVFTLELWILRLASFGGRAREEVHCWRLANDERLFVFRRRPHPLHHTKHSVMEHHLLLHFRLSCLHFSNKIQINISHISYWLLVFLRSSRTYAFFNGKRINSGLGITFTKSKPLLLVTSLQSYSWANRMKRCRNQNVSGITHKWVRWQRAITWHSSRAPSDTQELFLANSTNVYFPNDWKVVQYPSLRFITIAHTRKTISEISYLLKFCNYFYLRIFWGNKHGWMENRFSQFWLNRKDSWCVMQFIFSW